MTQFTPLTVSSSQSPAVRAAATAHMPSTSELALTLLGPSAAMSQLWTQIRRLAPHVRSVLLTGSPDCGQEAVARLLLDLSPQNRRAFIQLTAGEAESKLLRPAALVSFPSDVLLFLPDIDKLSKAAQEALVRLMKLRRARSFTVVAAASEDLRGLVAVGRFSSELADAVSATQIQIPALRDRAEDLPMLISHLLSSQAVRSGKHGPQVSEEFLRAAIAHTWPGNLLELAQALSRLCAEGATHALQASDLHRALASYRPHRPSDPAPVRMVPLDIVMREHIVAVLRACRGNKLRAAEVLGISRSTLYRTLEAALPKENGPLPLAS